MNAILLPSAIPCHYTTPDLQNLHGLPVPWYIQYEVVLLTQKTNHIQVLFYLTHLLHRHTSLPKRCSSCYAILSNTEYQASVLPLLFWSVIFVNQEHEPIDKREPFIVNSMGGR